ncbi:MAG TPA: multicopper oxidase domain-containing protein [Ktedonobacteraceae bacterium]|nr:multicopper oxidase domain-containing protein [Ktedonobacteraceae bacterium]
MTQNLPHQTPAPGQENQTIDPPVSDASGVTRRGLLKGAAIGAASLGALGNLALPSGVAAAAPQHTTTSPAIVEFPRGGQLQEYWFQADSFFHNVMPTGVDGMTGNTFIPSQTSYWAIGYRAFTPGWGKPLPGNNDIGVNTGIPGPIIRGQVGDTIRVHFRNNDTYYRAPHSISVHALSYTMPNDGGWAWMFSDRPGTAVNVGETYTYEWKAIPRSVGTWPYHDHSKHFDPGKGTMVMEAGAELGLFGMLAITDQNTPKVDNELSVIWHSLYSADIPGLSQDFHCFDGLAYLGNTPTLQATVGQRVRWRVVALGNDFHTFHIHGHTWLFNGRYDDTIVFGPGATLTFDYVEDAPGIWYYHCHVPMHVMGPGMGGMIGLYLVSV